MIGEIKKNSSADKKNLTSCQNCSNPAVVEEQQLRKCCNSPKFEEPKSNHRYVNFRCQKTVKLVPERFDLFVCYICEKYRIIADAGMEVSENLVVFGMRNLSKQEAKIIRRNNDLVKKLTAVNEELRLAKIARKQNGTNVLLTAVAERRIDILKKQLTHLATEYIAVSSAAKYNGKTLNSLEIPIVWKGKICKNTVRPMKKICKRIVA